MYVSTVGSPCQQVPTTSHLISIKLILHAKEKCTFYTRSLRLLKNSMTKGGRL